MLFSKRKLSRSIVIVIIIILALFFLNLIGILSPLNNLISRPLGWFQQWFYKAGVDLSNTEVRLLSKAELIELNQELKDQVLDLTIRITELKIFEEENKELVKQLDFLSRQPYQTVTARIIGRSPDYSEDILIINRGSKDGLKDGLAVIAEEGVLIGKIIKTERNQSKVMVLTDAQSKVAAAILNQNRTVGLVEGQYGLSAKLGLIPQNEEVKVNDLVITSGLEENIPKGLLIAKVDHLTTQPNDVFQSALLSLLLDYNKINLVSVILP